MSITILSGAINAFEMFKDMMPSIYCDMAVMEEYSYERAEELRKMLMKRIEERAGVTSFAHYRFKVEEPKDFENYSQHGYVAVVAW